MNLEEYRAWLEENANKEEAKNVVPGVVEAEVKRQLTSLDRWVRL